MIDLTPIDQTRIHAEELGLLTFSEAGEGKRHMDVAGLFTLTRDE